MRVGIIGLTAMLLFVSWSALESGMVDSASAQGCSYDYDDRIGTDPDTFTTYYSYDQMEARLFELAGSLPQMRLENEDADWRAELEPTWQDRENWIMKVAADPDLEDPELPDIFLAGNHHANEWIGTMATMYFLSVVEHTILATDGLESFDNDQDGRINEDPLDGIDNDGDGEDDDGDPSTPATWNGLDDDCDGFIDEGIDEDWDEGWVRNLIETHEVYVMPMPNPDGYQYDRTEFSGEEAWDDGGGDGWRRNMRDVGPLTPDACRGTDMNRNYPYQWNGPGVNSLAPCQPFFAGPPDTADQDGDFSLNEDPWDDVDNDLDGLRDEDRDGGLSEPETRNIWRLVENNDDDGDGETDFVTYLDLHTPGEVVLYPWGYTTQPVQSPDYEILLGMATALAAGSNYEPIQASEYFQAGPQGVTVAGTSMDTMWGKAGIYAFTTELDINHISHPVTIEPLARRVLHQMFYMIEISDNPANAAAELIGQHTPEIIEVQHPGARTDKDELEFTIVVNGTPTRALLHYRFGEAENLAQAGEVQQGDYRWGSWREVTMKFDSGDANGSTWNVFLPPQEALTLVEYYFVTKDYAGDDYEPAAGRHGAYLIEVTFGRTTWLEIGSGWATALVMFGIIYGLLTVALRRMMTAERIKTA